MNYSIAKSATKLIPFRSAARNLIMQSRLLHAPTTLPDAFHGDRVLTKEALLRSEPREYKRMEAPIADDDEDDEMLSSIDKMLLERALNPPAPPRQVNVISTKVIRPYNSFDDHRAHWAEFRRRLIYGRY